MANKQGRFSKKDDIVIKRNYKDLSVEDLAKKLKKTVPAVFHRMGVLGLNASTEEERKLGAYADIRQSVYWKQLKEELTAEELRLFIEHWKDIISQFQHDIYHTEKLQVMDLIKTEILMSRDLRREKELNDSLIKLKNEMKEVEKSDMSQDQKMQRLEMLRQEYGHAISISRDMRVSYEKMAAEKKHLLRSMKASRDQRIKRLEDSKDNIHGWLLAIIQDTETRRRIGLEMEKMRIAAKVEYERLTEYHEYEDKTIDTPITNSEVVLKKQEEEQNG